MVIPYYILFKLSAHNLFCVNGVYTGEYDQMEYHIINHISNIFQQPNSPISTEIIQHAITTSSDEICTAYVFYDNAWDEWGYPWDWLESAMTRHQMAASHDSESESDDLSDEESDVSMDTNVSGDGWFTFM
jgi:hypothetical protein